MHVWKTLKVFISSTFKDLELERDRLAQVFQHIQQKIFQIFDCRLHLICYDLRWRQAEETNLVQKQHLEQLTNFCMANGERNYLAVHAVAGTGKPFKTV